MLEDMKEITPARQQDSKQEGCLSILLGYLYRETPP
jgi:hypothetical protein